MKKEKPSNDFDWETTGEDEMRKLCEDSKQRVNLSTVEIRDKLNNLSDLVEVCSFALGNKDMKGQEYLEERVGLVLNFFVVNEIKLIEEELRYV